MDKLRINKEWFYILKDKKGNIVVFIPEKDYDYMMESYNTGKSKLLDFSSGLNDITKHLHYKKPNRLKLIYWIILWYWIKFKNFIKSNK